MKHERIRSMVGIAFLTAIVVVLQLLGQFVRFGPVSVSLVLVPIVVGAAVYGPASGAILGAAFSIVVLLQPDTAVFYNLSVIGTVLVVLVKGTLAGYLSGLVFRAISPKQASLAVLASAAVCPIVNTGIFFLGCRLFFWEGLSAWTAAGTTTLMFVITGMIGINFIAEIFVNVICAPVILRILRAVNRK